MSTGFIVIPFGSPGTPIQELRVLAHDLQEEIAARIGIPGVVPMVSHWLEHPVVVEVVALHLQGEGHAFPECEACP